MSFLGAEIDGPMVVARAVHFAASATVAGALLFRTVVADPALRGEYKAGSVVDRQIRTLAWIALAIAVISGGAWLLLQTASMSGQTRGEVMVSGALLAVLDETQFGLVSEVRLALALLLAICLAYRACRLDTVQAGLSAPDSGRAAPLWCCGLDRWPDGACAIAERHRARWSRGDQT
jgi:copper resistance protein D